MVHVQRNAYNPDTSKLFSNRRTTQEGRGRNQIDTFNSLTNLDQTSPPKNKKDDSHNKKAKNQSFGCKLRVLFGYDNGKPCATITSSKEEIDSQFWYPRRNRAIKEYKSIKDFYSSCGEDDSEMVDKETTANSTIPKTYDLRTPVKRANYAEIVLSSESPTKNDEAKEFEKLDKVSVTSFLKMTSSVQMTKSHYSQELSLVDQLLMEDQTRPKCSGFGESYCDKTFQ